MNMEEIPTTFDKKEISLYRKNIAIAILLRGSMYSNKQNISVNLWQNFILQLYQTTLNFH